MISNLSVIRDWTMWLFDAYICWILTVEYFFDKKIYEQKRKMVRRTKNKVVITIENGQAIIKEQPKDIDVIVENK